MPGFEPGSSELSSLVAVYLALNKGDAGKESGRLNVAEPTTGREGLHFILIEAQASARLVLITAVDCRLDARERGDEAVTLGRQDARRGR